MYSAILFDFDGTLTPSLELWVRAFEYALAIYDIELDEADIVRRCFNQDYPIVAEELGIASWQEFAGHIETGLAQAFAESARLFPMVEELLASCKQAGLATALVTSASRNQVETSLARFGIADYFDTVVTADDVERYKPHPEPVELALSRLNKTPAETLFVGDNKVDILAGKAAGVHTALFFPELHSRFYSLEAFRASQPDFVFTSHAEVLEHLQLNGQPLKSPAGQG